MINESSKHPPMGNQHPDVMDLTTSTKGQVKPLGKEGGSKSRKDLSPNDDENEARDGDVAPGKHVLTPPCWHDVMSNLINRRAKVRKQESVEADEDAEIIREAVESGDGDVVLEYVEWMQGHLEQLTEESSSFAEAHESLVEEYNELAEAHNELVAENLQAQLKVHLQDFMFGASKMQLARAWKWMVDYEDLEKMATDNEHCAKRLKWIKASVVGRPPMDFNEQVEREGESLMEQYGHQNAASPLVKTMSIFRKAEPLPDSRSDEQKAKDAWHQRFGIRKWKD
jgi:hypothetical protein